MENKQPFLDEEDFFKSTTITEGGLLLKAGTHKYVKRTGVKGNYKYWYRVNGKLVVGKKDEEEKSGVKTINHNGWKIEQHGKDSFTAVNPSGGLMSGRTDITEEVNNIDEAKQWVDNQMKKKDNKKSKEYKMLKFGEKIKVGDEQKNTDSKTWSKIDEKYLREMIEEGMGNTYNKKINEIRRPLFKEEKGEEKKPENKKVEPKLIKYHSAYGVRDSNGEEKLIWDKNKAMKYFKKLKEKAGK